MPEKTASAEIKDIRNETITLTMYQFSPDLLLIFSVCDKTSVTIAIHKCFKIGFENIIESTCGLCPDKEISNK